MTKQDLFRAVGEIREDQILDAERPKKTALWRRCGAMAACLALLVTAVLALPERQTAGDQGAGALDGTEYSSDAAAQPLYSAGAEIGELDGVPKPKDEVQDSSSCLVWLEPEEILAMDTVIFRGTVRNLRYFQVTAGGAEMYYTVAAVEVTDCIRGELADGDLYNVLYPGVPNRMTTSVSGALEDLKVGSDGVFMPYRAGEDTGWRSGKDWFCYADLAELYFSEGIRFLFLDTGEELSFERDVYTDIADASTLDEVADYLRENVPGADQPREAFQRAGEVLAEPIEPQTAPADTRDALRGEGPAGARELPGGAAMEEK